VFQQTTTKRLNLLYQQKGFDEDQWNELVAEGKKLGREIKAIGKQYGVKWNPKVEATGRAEGVLEKEDKKDNRVKKAREKETDDDEEDD
jgi:calcium uniporter protein, mitochondrial